MKSSATGEFWKHFAGLPPELLENARKAYRLWLHDPHHGSLRFKKVRGVWSVRLAAGYRVLGLLKGDTIHWFWIGSHDESSGC